MARQNAVVIDLEVRNSQARKSLQQSERSFNTMSQAAEKSRRSIQGVNKEMIQETKLARVQAGSVEDLSNRIRVLTESRDRFANPAIIGRYNKKIEQLHAQRTKLQSFGTASGMAFGQASGGANRATLAVVNLSRIVEDAPFGVRGVANNINPFIQSFQRLKKETGSTGAVMKAMLSSAFTGPGGLLLISALATSAMVAMQMGLFDFGEQAEETEEALQGVVDRIDRIIELKDQFGAFDDDEFGLLKLEDRIRDINKALVEENQTLSEIRKKNKEIAEIQTRAQSRGAALQQAGQLNREEAKRLEILQNQIKELGDEEKIKEEIEKLERDRLETSEDLVTTSAALSDEGVKQARAAQKAREEKEKRLKKEKEITEELEKRRAKFGEQLESAREGVRPERPEDEVISEDIDVDRSLDLGERLFPEGSLGRLKQKLSELKEQLDFAVNPTRVEALKQEIKELQDQIKELGGEVEKESKQFEMAMARAAAAAILRADSASEAGRAIVDSLLSEIVALAIRSAIRDLPFPVNLIAAAGAALAARQLRSLIPGFAMGTDQQFPGMGMVGERGPEMIVAPPFSSVITNENIERLASMRDQARDNAINIASSGASMGAGNGDIARAVHAAITEALPQAQITFPISDHEAARHKFEQKETAIGN